MFISANNAPHACLVSSDYARRALAGLFPVGKIAGMDIRDFCARFGAAILARRKQLKITQEELASRIGTDQANISRLENGEQGFSVETLLSLAAALALPVSELLRRTESENDQAFSEAIDDLAAARIREPEQFRAYITLISGHRHLPPQRGLATKSRRGPYKVDRKPDE